MGVHKIMKDHGVHMEMPSNLKLRDALEAAHLAALREQREGIAKGLEKWAKETGMDIGCKDLILSCAKFVRAFDVGKEDGP